MPCSAALVRLRPSKPNGVVTTPTVKIPISLAIEAITGAAPVPVPPPMPAVINTISAPSSDFWIASRSSSAAWRPTSGFAPAPKPRVLCVPSCNRIGADILSSACLSVLAHTNFTPVMPERTICSTALPPPPPTPNTVNRAWPLSSEISVSTSLKDDMSSNSTSATGRLLAAVLIYQKV